MHWAVHLQEKGQMRNKRAKRNPSSHQSLTQPKIMNAKGKKFASLMQHCKMLGRIARFPLCKKSVASGRCTT
jgi:hypothetical protein